MGILENYLGISSKRPDIIAQEYAVMIAKANVNSAKSRHFPTFSLEGNYYVKRYGIRNGINWDIVAGIEIPIFSWGEVNSSIREANCRLFAEELTLNKLKRQVELDVRTSWEELRTSISELALYEKASSLALDNYNLQTIDYRKGLVSNLEVLQALNTLYNIKLRRTQVLYRTIINNVRLQVAVGDIPILDGEK